MEADKREGTPQSLSDGDRNLSSDELHREKPSVSVAKSHPEVSKRDLWVVLPSELLIEIFRHTISGPMPLSPLHLGRICRFWRELAFGSGQLWRHVLLKLVCSRSHTQLSVLEQWLQRAMNSPLSLDISYSSSLCCKSSPGVLNTCARQGIYDGLNNILQMHSARVSNLTLCLPGTFFTALSESETTFGTLAQLSISTNSGGSIQIEEAPVRAFESSYHLTNATISLFYVSSFILPWIHLLHVQLQDVAPYEMCEVILWSPNLQTLDTTFVIDSDDGAEEIQLPSTITHHNLQRLTFSEIDQGSFEYTTKAFDQLRLIDLKSFTLILGASRPLEWGPDPVLLLHPFVSASIFPLEELSIQYARISEPDLIACLCLLPSLRLLDLTGNAQANTSYLGSDLFRFMTLVPGEHNNILPNLHSFVFQRSEVAFSPDVIIALLESWWGPPNLPGRSPDHGHSTPLQTVVFHLEGPCCEITSTHEEMFDGWRGIGYSLVVTGIGFRPGMTYMMC